MKGLMAETEIENYNSLHSISETFSSYDTQHVCNLFQSIHKVTFHSHPQYWNVKWTTCKLLMMGLEGPRN